MRSGSGEPPAALEDFSEFCAKLKLENGSPFELKDFQRRMLSDYFGGTTETLILISKKNGKTTLLAALALHHLLVTPDAECVIAAASRDQAQILLNQARGFVRRSTLGKYMTVKQREIVSLRDEGRVRVLASDSDTADGVIPTLAIVDELHRHKDNGAMYGVFHDGLGPRQGRIVTISTAGDDEESALGKLRQAAYRLPGMTRRGAYRYATSGDFAMHEWALEADEDREDMQAVKRANPAPWQTVEELTKRFESPSMTPTRWARFACGVWVKGEDSAITEGEWASLRTDDCIPAGEPVWVGLDIAWKWDTTAVAPLWMPDIHRRLFGKPTILTPPRDGTSLPPEDVQEALLEVHRGNPVHTVVMDENAGGAQLASWIETELGARVVSHSQGHTAMALAYERWMEAMREGWLQHTGDPEFARHVLNAIARLLPGGQIRFDRPAKSRAASAQDARVWDALTAASMVHSIAVAEAAEPTRSLEVAFL